MHSKITPSSTLKLLTFTISGFLLMGAGFLNLDAYWASPKAAAQDTHDWSELEKNMRPEACAQCHETQFNAWKSSRHSKAFSPGMIGQFADMNHSSGNDCLRCHAPLSQQLFKNDKHMLHAMQTLKNQPQGINQEAGLESPQAKLPLRHAGVSCAVCHVRNGERFGPPRLGTSKEGHIKTEVHGGFIANKIFEQSKFCAECHQFPQSYAINGKPLENTVVEWQQSRFAAQGKQCQSCHMPNRKHVFKGIHDKTFTAQGLEIKAFLQQGIAQLSIHSKNIGHAFPTYVTPKTIVQAQALNKQSEIIKTWQWEIVREVYFNDGWQEKRDSRLLPDERRLYLAKDAPSNTQEIKFEIKVIPDYFYKGVYESILADAPSPTQKILIQRALDEANQGDYVLFSQSIGIE